MYAKKRKAFLEAHPYCQIWMARHAGIVRDETSGDVVGFMLGGVPPDRSSEVHHKAGRTGKNYLDESTWMAVSREGHTWIHEHPSEARARGWLR